ALKSIWMSTDRDISIAENSALRKRYRNFLRTLSEERDSERGRTATLLLQEVWGAVPTVQHSVVIQLWGVPFLPGDETHGVKEFWECVNLDKKVTKER
ncbi:1978_t:CDS:2, partial [Paraglomus occultum]